MLRMLDEQRLYIVTDNLLGERNSVRLRSRLAIVVLPPAAHARCTVDSPPRAARLQRVAPITLLFYFAPPPALVRRVAYLNLDS
jgi:hypothetical protein